MPISKKCMYDYLALLEFTQPPLYGPFLKLFWIIKMIFLRLPDKYCLYQVIETS